MSTMIERVARAIFEVEYPGGETDEYRWDRSGDVYRQQARAAIEAMREPTAAMLCQHALLIGFAHDSDGIEDNVYVDKDEALATWRAMIQAALKESRG